MDSPTSSEYSDTSSVNPSSSIAIRKNNKKHGLFYAQEIDEVDASYSLYSSTLNTMQRQSEVYGFVLWVLSFFLIITFFVWAYIPEKYLHDYGIAYYPDKMWALSIPAFISFTALCLVIFLILCVYKRTPPLDDLFTVQDSPLYNEKQERLSESFDEFEPRPQIPPIEDIPVTFISQALFHKKVVDESHEDLQIEKSSAENILVSRLKRLRREAAAHRRTKSTAF